MPKTYSIIISDIVSEQLLARTLWSVAVTAPEGLMEVVVRHAAPLKVCQHLSSALNIKQVEKLNFWLPGEVVVFINGDPIITPGCLEPLIETCTPKIEAGAAIYGLTADRSLTLDQFGTNLQASHIEAAKRHPIRTMEYDSGDKCSVTAKYTFMCITKLNINNEAIALKQEMWK